MEISPLLILAVGMITVVGLIIVLRLNAFIAMIAAAMIVSLMSPGDVADKIARVATAFGSSAGKIGIVIAMAAVIGKCMMDSGAADRVVRAFLRALGERQASLALMGSGFVLAIPVFFDTVFYLLVPLARSLFRKTQRNYLKYVLAIVAGGAITHTLVPPTPGPLIMAAQLQIDIGVMMLVGGLVALVPALAGILFAGVADRILNIPMRDIAGQKEPEQLEESQLPSLFLSLLPIVLPVLLISSDTVTTTIADAQDVTVVRTEDLRDAAQIRTRLLAGAAAEQPGPEKRMWDMLPQSTKDSLNQASQPGAISSALVEGFNQLLPQTSLYDKASFLSLELRFPDPLKTLIAQGPASLRPVDRARLNRLLLETTFPDELARHEWQTPIRKLTHYTGLIGNANTALLLAMVIAMVVLYRQRDLTLGQLGSTVEVALMSGGVIILITAAGGAFGEMLKVANVGDAIRNLFGTQAVSGFAVLWFGFGIAALLKVAQGSSTVAMIAGSSMIAAMGLESLPFHPVYLATAIGSGSLVGSWMNDSGFWIFVKMSGLTEVEGLKSWTILLLWLGVIGMAMTLLMANVLPLNQW